MNIGQHRYVPVMIAKGSNPGKYLLLKTGIHDDKLNGLRVTQIYQGTGATREAGSLLVRILNIIADIVIFILKANVLP
jgi:hypothetical protein